MKEELIKIQTEGEGYIALWKITPNENISNKNVLLTHGTFSNRKVMKGITEYLVKNEFTCWIFEWINHGSSSRLKEKFNFESIGKKDFKLVFQYLFNECQIKQIDCIAYSGGGICLTIALINHPQYQNKIKSITMFGCQAFGTAHTKWNYIKLLMGKYLSKLYGSIPATLIGGEENEPYFMMKQWFDWNLKKQFIGDDGIDYRAKMSIVKTPVLSIYGAGDKFIAPPEGCELFILSFNNELNKTLFCSKSTGFSEDYNHSRLIYSRSARNEIYPDVLDWINVNNPSYSS